MLKGAMCRGILRNNTGKSFIKDYLERNKFKSSLEMEHHVAEQDKKRIDAEKQFNEKEISCRCSIVESARAHYKSGAFD